MTAGQEFALLGGGRIAHEWQQIGLHPGIVEQRIALGRRAVSSHRRAGALLLQQKGENVVLQAVGLRLEIQVNVKRSQATPGLLVEQHRDRLGCRAIIIDMTAIDAQAAAMGGQFLDIEDAQTRAVEDARRGMQREIREVVMIYRVELLMFEQSH